MIGLLLEIKSAVEQASPITDCLSAGQLRSFEARYQILLNEGYTENSLSPINALSSRAVPTDKEAHDEKPRV
jgi:hypothetical protein